MDKEKDLQNKSVDDAKQVINMSQIKARLKLFLHCKLLKKYKAQLPAIYNNEEAPKEEMEEDSNDIEAFRK